MRPIRDRRGGPAQRLAKERKLAAARRNQRGQDLQKRALPGAVGAEERRKAAAGQLEVDLVEDHPLVDHLAQAVGPNRGRGARLDRERGMGKGDGHGAPLLASVGVSAGV
jgi:hypothetical protein